MHNRSPEKRGFQSYSKRFWYHRIVKDILKRHLGLVCIKIAVIAFLIGDLFEIDQNLLKNVHNTIGDYFEMDQKLRKIILQYDWGIIWTRRKVGDESNQYNEGSQSKEHLQNS